MPGETRSRPAFTPSVHAGPSRGSFTLHAASFTPSVHSILQRSRPLFTHLSTRSRAPFTHSVHAFTRSAHPFTRTGTPVRRTGRVSLPSARRRRARARARARPLPVAPLTPPLLPAALGGTWCHLTPHAVSALEHARFRGAPGVGCWRRGRRAPCRPTQQQPADGPTGSRSAPYLGTETTRPVRRTGTPVRVNG